MTPFGVVSFWPHVISWHNPFCSVLAERVGQGEVGGCTTLADTAWRLLQLPVENPWSLPGGPFVCFLAQTGIENVPFTL